MSQRAKIPHLVLAKGIGFQYHLLPKALNAHPEQPESVRWSLGLHSETALHLATSPWANWKPATGCGQCPL